MSRDTSSGIAFENLIEAGLMSVGIMSVESNDDFAKFVFNPKLCASPCYRRHFKLDDEQKISGKQELDFAIIIPIDRPVARYSLRRERICMGIECKSQTSSGSADRKCFSAVDDLIGWGKYLPHGRLVLGGPHWGSQGKRIVEELKVKCAGADLYKGQQLRVLKTPEFSNEIAVLTGRKWEISDLQLAVISKLADKRQRELFT